jgi:hypothetical protein
MGNHLSGNLLFYHPTNVAELVEKQAIIEFI